MGVAKHLDFNVPWTLHIFLDQYGVVAKVVDGFALATGERGGKVFGLVHRPHALAATARTGLDQHRVTDAVGLALQQTAVLVGAVVARHQGHASFFHQLFGLGLQAHGLDGGRRRANEYQPGLGTGLGEFFVLAQEPIARVNRLGTGGLGRGDDFFPAQVAVLGRAAANMHGLVTGRHMFGTGIGVRVHSDRFDGQPARGGRHTAGNFATIGDQDFAKHRRFSR